MAIREAQADNQLGNAMARGMVTQEEYDEATGSADNKNWLQKIIFDAPRAAVGLLGADVYEDEGSPHYNPNEFRGGLKHAEHQASGGTLETLGDVLMLGSYVGASFAEARTQNIHFDKNRWHPGHFVSSFANAWGNRTSWTQFAENHDVFGSDRANFWGGLTADILLDPLTYMTLGVAPGAKVIASKVISNSAKSGSKLAGRAAGSSLTLNNYGTAMYRLAAERLNPRYLEEANHAFRNGRGNPNHLLDLEDATKWNQKIVEYMVDQRNFRSLHEEILRRRSQGRFRTLTRIAPASEANRASLSRLQTGFGRMAPLVEGSVAGDVAAQGLRAIGNAGQYTVDDMFRETAVFNVMGREVGKEVGFRFDKAQRILARGDSTRARVFTKVFDTFDRGWDAPADVVQAVKMTENLIERDLNQALIKYKAALGAMGSEERSMVSRIIESGESWDEAGVGTLSGAMEWGDDITEAVRFVKAEMDEILELERAAGFDVNKVENYISHVYGLNPQQAEYAKGAIIRNGEENVRSLNKFRQQRMIASIADGEEIFGEGALLTDAMDILRIRKRASAQMIHRTNLHKTIIKEHGLPALLVNGFRDGMKGGLLRGFMRRAAYGVSEVLNVRQVWKSENGSLTRLGFRKPKTDADLAHNKDMLTWLMRPVTDEGFEGPRRLGAHAVAGRSTPEAIAEADRLELNTAARTFTINKVGETVTSGSVKVQTIKGEALPQSFGWAPTRSIDVGVWTARGSRKAKRKVTERFDVSTIMEMVMDKDHPMWDELFLMMTKGKKKHSFSMSPINGVMGGFHKYLVKHLDSQLVGFIPDIERRVQAAMESRLISRLESAVPDTTIPKTKRDADLASRKEAMILSFRTDLAKTFSGMSEPIKASKFKPQVPQALIDLAVASQRAAGIYINDAKPTKWQNDALITAANKLGFDSDTLKQLSKAMFDSDAPSNAGEMDELLTLFHNLTDNTLTARRLGLADESGELVQNGPFGGELVSRRFVMDRMDEGNVFPELMDNKAFGRRAEDMMDLTIPVSRESRESDKINRQYNKARAKAEEVRKAEVGLKNQIKKIDADISKLPADVSTRKAELKVSRRIRKTIKIFRDLARKGEAAIGSGKNKVIVKSGDLSNPELIRVAEDLASDIAESILRKMNPSLTSDQAYTTAASMVKNLGSSASSIRTLDGIYKEVGNRLRQANKEWRDGGYASHARELGRLNREKNKLKRSMSGLSRKRIRTEAGLRAAADRAGMSVEDRIIAGRELMDDAMGQPLTSPTRGVSEQIRHVNEIQDRIDVLQDAIGKSRNPHYSWKEELDELLAAKAELLETGTKSGAEAIQRLNASSIERQYWQARNALDGLKSKRQLDPGDMATIRSLEKRASDLRDKIGYRPANGAVAKGDVIRAPKTYEVDVYLPKSIAKILDDYGAPMIDPSLKKTEFGRMVYETIRKYDAVQTYFKSNLLLAWSGTWARNAFSAGLMNYVTRGIQLLDPTNNFETMNQFTHCMRYALVKHTDFWKAFGWTKDNRDIWLKKSGDLKITSRQTGREIQVKDLVDEGMIRGVFKSMHATEAMDIMARGQGIGASATLGAVAGGVIAGPGGALAGGLGGAAVGSKLHKYAGAEQSVGGGVSGLASGAALGALAGAPIEDPTASSYISAMTGVAGTILGARRMGTRLGSGAAKKVLPKKVAGAMGGIPVAKLDGVTGLLQSQWMPFLRAGEMATETPFRLATFLGSFHETGSMAAATKNVSRALNDWSNLSVFERRIMRRVVPFYNWTKHAVKFTMRESALNPGRMSQAHKLVNSWNIAHGYDPEDVPEFFQEKLGMLSETGDGEMMYTSGAGAPQEDFANLVNALIPGGSGSKSGREEFLHGVMGRGPFGAVSVLEGAFNTDTFTGREIQSDAGVSYFQQGHKWAGAPGWLKHLVGYKPASASNVATVDPQMAWLLGEIPVSRFVDLMKKVHRLDREGKDETNLATLAKSFLGVTAYKFDPDAQKMYVNKAKIDRMVALLAAAGTIKSFESFYSVNPDDRNPRRRGGGYRRLGYSGD
ncbi:MAG: hypothetical protein CL484_12045 [Acidobacteria bacterium]|nr:hypothetical protein [Acidobacteriota bacterium]